VDDAGAGCFGQIGALCRERGLVVLLGILAMAAATSSVYGGVVWSVGHLKSTGMDPVTADLVGSLAHMVQFIVTPLAAHLSDRIGVAWVMIFGAALVAMLAIPINTRLVTNPGDLGAAVLGISVGYGVTSSVAMASTIPFFTGFFPTQSRAIGFSLTFNVAVSYFGGFSSMVLQALSEVSPDGPGLYMAGLGLMSLSALVALVYLRSRGVIQITYIRDEPFCLMPSCISGGTAKQGFAGGGRLRTSSAHSEGSEDLAKGSPESPLPRLHARHCKHGQHRLPDEGDADTAGEAGAKVPPPAAAAVGHAEEPWSP